MKVRIKKAPTGGTQRVRVTSLPNQLSPNFVPGEAMSAPKFEVANTLQPVPRKDANIEAEKGETVLMPDKGGLPAHYKIGGNRHSNGGTPLNVTKDSFVYSDTKKLKIKDPDILAEFGKSKGAWTPADLAKKYDINKFRKILQDPDSDLIMVSTAEKMISNYNLKLAKLALVQESKKGFPQGIPEAAMPYLATYNIEPDSILPLKQETEDIPYEEIPQAKWGGIPKAQDGLTVSGQDPEALRKFYEDQMRKRQLREAAKEFEKKKAVAEFYAKERAAKLAAQKDAAKKKLDESYKTLEQLSGKKYLPLGSMKRAAGFDNAYDQYINNLGAYTSLFPPPPPMDTSGTNPNVPYQNLPFRPNVPPAAKPWPQIPKSAPAVVESSAPAPAASTDAGMEAEIKDLMNSEKISRKEAIYILTGK